METWEDLLQQGNEFFEWKDYEGAIASFDRAIEIKPDDHQAWYGRGLALSNLRRYEEVIASYDRAIEIKPDNHEVWNNQSIALENLGRYEEATASIKRAVETQKNLG